MSQMLPPQQQLGGAQGPQDPGPLGPGGPQPVPGGAQDQGGAPAPIDPMKTMTLVAALIQKFIQDEPDPAEKSLATKLLQGAHDIIANRGKERDAALGMTPALKFIQRLKHRQGAGGGGQVLPPGGPGA